MTRNEIREVVGPICSRHRVRRLDLFGSRARGEDGPDSDFDFCVLFEDLPPSEYSRQFFSLLHDLEDALHATIDLLTEGSIRRASLRSRIQSDGVCVYG